MSGIEMKKRRGKESRRWYGSLYTWREASNVGSHVPDHLLNPFYLEHKHVHLQVSDHRGRSSRYLLLAGIFCKGCTPIWCLFVSPSINDRY